MAGWIIFLSIPLIIGGIGAFLKFLFRKPHPTIGKRNELTALNNTDDTIFSIEALLGSIVVLKASSEVNELEGACRRLKRFSTFADQNQVVLKCFPVYVGEDIHNVIDQANLLYTKYSMPILVDKYGVFPRFFGKEYKFGCLIIDKEGTVRSAPRDRITGNDRKILAKIFKEMKTG